MQVGEYKSSDANRALGAIAEPARIHNPLISDKFHAFSLGALSSVLSGRSLYCRMEPRYRMCQSLPFHCAPKECEDDRDRARGKEPPRLATQNLHVAANLICPVDAVVDVVQGPVDGKA